MKLLKIIMILLISSFSYYGVVNDDGEKVTNIQEIMQHQNLVAEESIEGETKEHVEEQTEEKIKEPTTEIVEIKDTKVEESKETPVKKENTITKKKEVQNTSPNTEKKIEEQVIKKEEKAIEKTKDETTQIETKQDTSTQEKENTTVIPKCTETKHMVETGNSGQWFDTEQQAVAFYESEIKKWGDKWTNYEIDNDTYYKSCPDGYEDWSCTLCQKWTINLYY